MKTWNWNQFLTKNSNQTKIFVKLKKSINDIDSKIKQKDKKISNYNLMREWMSEENSSIDLNELFWLIFVLTEFQIDRSIDTDGFRSRDHTVIQSIEYGNDRHRSNYIFYRFLEEISNFLRSEWFYVYRSSIIVFL